MSNLESLLAQVSSINYKYQLLSEGNGESFNIFRLLKLDSNEVRLHSALIGDLLNPLGSHKQGNVFLNLFYETLGITQLELEDSHSTDVCIEEYAGAVSKDFMSGGRIDIVIKSKNQPPIVIENKIYAGDQEKQLVRYRAQYPNCKLYYLTLNGDLPSYSSIINIDGQKLKEQVDYHTLSYKSDIMGWLISCRKAAVEKPLIRETLTQYINLIKHLTNQTMSDANKKEILSTILSKPENIESAIEIGKIQRELKDEIMRLSKEKLLGMEPQFSELGLSMEFNQNYLFGRKESGVKLLKQNSDAVIYFHFNSDYEDLYCGIYPGIGSPINEKLREKLNNNLEGKAYGKKVNWSNWYWVSYMNDWDKMGWSEVEDRLPIEILKIATELSEPLEKVFLRSEKV